MAPNHLRRFDTPLSRFGSALPLIISADRRAYVFLLSNAPGAAEGAAREEECGSPTKGTKLGFQRGAASRGSERRVVWHSGGAHQGLRPKEASLPERGREGRQ